MSDESDLVPSETAESTSASCGARVPVYAQFNALMCKRIAAVCQFLRAGGQVSRCRVLPVRKNQLSDGSADDGFVRELPAHGGSRRQDAVTVW